MARDVDEEDEARRWGQNKILDCDKVFACCKAPLYQSSFCGPVLRKVEKVVRGLVREKVVLHSFVFGFQSLRGPRAGSLRFCFQCGLWKTLEGGRYRVQRGDVELG